MGYTPAFDAIDATHSLTHEQIELARPFAHAREARSVLRFGGLSMDTLTGVTFYRGKAVPLSAHERELLGVFLRRAGQIISREQIAATLGVGAGTLDARVQALRGDLKAAGVGCLPCAADGLGYVLWRC